jgi:hypothetical protein
VIEAQEQRGLPELLVPHLRQVLLDLDRMGALAERVKRSLRVLSSFMRKVKLSYGGAELALDIDPEVGAADGGDLNVDLATLFVSIGEAAQARSIPLAVLLDEVQYLSEAHLAALILAIHRLNQAGLPFLLVATGLPQVVGLTGQAKNDAERLFDFPIIDALSAGDSDDALQRPAIAEGAEWDGQALATVREITRGYPYFLQEWGYHTWNLAAGPRITAEDVWTATRIAIARLDESFFRVRYDRSGCQQGRPASQRVDPEGHDLRSGPWRHRIHGTPVQ